MHRRAPGQIGELLRRVQLFPRFPAVGVSVVAPLPWQIRDDAIKWVRRMGDVHLPHARLRRRLVRGLDLFGSDLREIHLAGNDSLLVPGGDAGPVQFAL